MSANETCREDYAVSIAKTQRQAENEAVVAAHLMRLLLLLLLLLVSGPRARSVLVQAVPGDDGVLQVLSQPDDRTYAAGRHPPPASPQDRHLGYFRYVKMLTPSLRPC